MRAACFAFFTSAGSLVGKEDHGDWTSDGFVVVDDVHISGPRLILEARWLLIVALGRTLQFRTAEQPTPDEKGTQPVSVEITVDFGKDIRAVEQADNARSRIFLERESRSRHIDSGLLEPVRDCQHQRKAPGLRLFPGRVPLASSSPTVTATYDSPGALTNGLLFRVGDGVSPESDLSARPRVQPASAPGKISGHHDPDAGGEPGRRSHKYQHRHPLGCGLDAKALQAVGVGDLSPREGWTACAVEIAVEVTFHPY